MTAPGSVVILANAEDWRRCVIAPDQQIIATRDCLDVATPPPDRLLGIYSETKHGCGPEIRYAQQLHTRVFYAHDAPEAYPAIALRMLRPWDVPMVQCYLEPHESVDDAHARWWAHLGDLLAVWPGTVGVLVQTYTKQWTMAPEVVADALPYLVSLVNRAPPRVGLVAAFAWWRADGCIGPCWTDPDTHAVRCPSPLLAATVRTLAAAAPRPFVFPAIPGPPPPPPPPPPPVVASRSLALLFQEFQMAADRAPLVISSTQLTKHGEGVTVRITNPLSRSWIGCPPAGTLLEGPQGNDVILSVASDGGFHARPKDAVGSDETAKIVAGCLAFQYWLADGTFLIPFDGLK